MRVKAKSKNTEEKTNVMQRVVQTVMSIAVVSTTGDTRVQQKQDALINVAT
eukprot:m.370181 g.370181  ORF g.370181 m.370181 type:complete len:51 (+) comp52743_c0_seq1:37-189(+)